MTDVQRKKRPSARAKRAECGRIKALRIAAGYQTGQAWADALGADPAQVCRWESYIVPEPPRLEQMCRVAMGDPDRAADAMVWVYTGRGKAPLSVAR